jgi:hypothetical protein
MRGAIFPLPPYVFVMLYLVKQGYVFMMSYLVNTRANLPLPLYFDRNPVLHHTDGNTFTARLSRCLKDVILSRVCSLVYKSPGVNDHPGLDRGTEYDAIVHSDHFSSF